MSIALTLDTTGSTSTGDTLLTQSLLIELSELCRVEVEEDGAGGHHRQQAVARLWRG